jgi:hypothetical protein
MPNTIEREASDQKLGQSKLMDFLNRQLEYLVEVGPFKSAIYLALIVFCIERWPDEPQLVMLCAFALVVRRLAFSWIYWAVITIIFTATHWMSWYHGDNHWYLFFYWCIAITLCLPTDNPAESLAKSARWLLGLVFALSTFWKLTSLEFLSGNFIEYAILADVRLSPVALLLGLGGDTLLTNRDILANFLFAGAPSGEAHLVTSAAVPLFAKLIAWWMLLLQALVAAVFILPTHRVSTFWRHTPMLVFLYTTYPIAQVSGFGFTLTGIALCQLKPNSKPIYLALYLLAFLMVFVSKNPGIRGILHHMGYL